MGKKPSERRHFRDEEMELNLVPMMNLIAILIPILLISMAFVEIAVINVSAQALGSNVQAKSLPQKEEASLDLSVTLTEHGYKVSSNAKALRKLNGSQREESLSIPLIEEEVSCLNYLGTTPPPRKINQKFSTCVNPEKKSFFKVYDTEKLKQILVSFKGSYPKETRIKIAAEKEIEFEALTEVMDVAREIKNSKGEQQELFWDVVLSPNLS
jgi:biopolymer transport protein ExbD